MDDLISRQAAIDALREAENHAFGSFYKGLVKAHKIIADIPSAQLKKTCASCLYRELAWHDEPCDSCTVGGDSSHYKRRTDE